MVCQAENVNNVMVYMRNVKCVGWRNIERIHIKVQENQWILSAKEKWLK